tara:strand:+ start:2115 stop:3647 length:1533 start_codon:yes stop_codon:yes gene_type:complete
MNKQAMVQRVAYLKIAEMERQAFLSKAKKIIEDIMSSLPSGWQRFLQGADEDEIKRAIRKLQKDKKFKGIIDSAPPKSSLRSLFDYFSFSIKRAFRFTGATLLALAIFAVVASLLGSIAPLIGGNIGLLIVGLMLGDGYAGNDSENYKQNASEIAKGRLLNKYAKIDKQAHFLSGIQKKLTELFLKEAESNIEKEAKGQSRSSKMGLAWAASEVGLNGLEDMAKFAKKGEKADLKDPIQRLIYERTKSIKDPVEVANLIGEFIHAYRSRDIGEMAKTLKVDEEVMALVLLWYTRNKTADIGDERVRKIDKGTEKLLNFSAKTLKFVGYLTGGPAIEWVVNLLPKGSLLGKPLKWGWWSVLLIKRWAILSSAYSLATAGITSLGAYLLAGGAGSFMQFVAIAFPVFVNPLTIFLTITMFLHQFCTVSKEEVDWGLKNPFSSLFVVPARSVFAILKQLFTGAIKVGKAVYTELKEYILENATFFKSLLPDVSSWLSESRAFSPREQDQLAVV